jgi:flagellar basal-body rod protein FlgB
MVPLDAAGKLHCDGIMLENTGVGIERYMNLLSASQKLVSSNIANVDTPGYRTKDVDFQSELASQFGSLEPTAVEVSGLKTKNDGNNVNMDRESRRLSENALRFAVATNLVRGQLQTLRSAIDEGKTA